MIRWVEVLEQKIKKCRENKIFNIEQLEALIDEIKTLDSSNNLRLQSNIELRKRVLSLEEENQQLKKEIETK